MSNEYIEAYRLFAKAAGIVPDEEACVFVATANENGILTIIPGKPGGA